MFHCIWNQAIFSFTAIQSATKTVFEKVFGVVRGLRGIFRTIVHLLILIPVTELTTEDYSSVFHIAACILFKGLPVEMVYTIDILQNK